MITSLTLVLLNVFLNRVTYHSSFLERIIDGKPQTLIHEGKLNTELMRSETLTDQELHEALRQQGVERVDQVKRATIETNGKISVIRKNS
jgi:uncharacterized membrane protein YcaP (DUF421 family)